MLGLALSLGAASPAWAQTPPDFSGTWRLDPTRTSTSGGPARLVPPGQPGDSITAPVKVRHVNPKYPSDLLRARAEGRVIIEAVIDRRGFVDDARVVVSAPGFDQAALEAVMQWRYTPALLRGEPVPVVMTTTVTFSLFGSPPRTAPTQGRSSTAGSGGGTGPGTGAQSTELTVSQTAEAVVITRETGAGRETLTFRLDGKPTRNRHLGRRGGPPGDYAYESRWDGAKLVSIITGPDDRKSSRTETRFLDGDTMIVEAVRPAPDGAPPWQTREVYARVR